MWSLLQCNPPANEGRAIHWREAPADRPPCVRTSASSVERGNQRRREAAPLVSASYAIHGSL